ncbi:MAG: efflux RND transporter periplasmic adaptor subunit [Bacteroidetes bacterium]|nr:efflux RND transporter periplasmic adaptor subunit [Bacteroidota bacterium]
MKLFSFFSVIAIFFLMFSCKSNAKEPIVSVDEQVISISQKQFETGNMEFGEMQKVLFEQVIHCHGNVISKPAGSAKVSTYISGLVNRIYCTPGQKIVSGQAIFEITGNDLIEFQKDFAESASLLVRVRSEYERLKSLFSENVGSEKELIFAESEYKATQARYSALKIKMQLLGLNTEKVENGGFYESYIIKSPISGYISQINVSLGQYADQQTAIAEVIDVSQFCIRIAVFEKDIPQLKEKQKVRIRLLGDPSEYMATLSSIGKNVDNETRTILCNAEIDDLGKANFVNNAYVEARIITSNDTVNAITEDAILKSGGNNYLLALEESRNETFFLNKVKVETGRTINGFVEILSAPELRKVLCKGAYNIQID